MTLSIGWKAGEIRPFTDPALPLKTFAASANEVDGRHPVLLRQSDQQLVMDKGERVPRNDQAAARLTSKFGDSLFDFGGVANRGRRHLNRE
jgi:hypothetical protein